jgi:hypothetical protein
MGRKAESSKYTKAYIGWSTRRVVVIIAHIVHISDSSATFEKGAVRDESINVWKWRQDGLLWVGVSRMEHAGVAWEKVEVG